MEIEGKVWPRPNSLASSVLTLAWAVRLPCRCRPVTEKAMPSGWLTVFMARPLTTQRRS